ncbi:MAG: hypothetical protein RSB47_02690 [Ruthenibacterium sp.]
MFELRKSLVALLKVKTIVTFVVIAVFAVLALQNRLMPDVVMGVVTMVVAFYFGTQSEKQRSSAHCVFRL